MKKALSVVLALLFVLSAFPLTALPVAAASASDLTFELNDDGASYYVSYCNEYPSGALTIPSTYKGKPVTSIGEEAFYGCDGLTSVTIPNSVTSIGDRAFYNCTGLTSITIGDSVTSIGMNAFSNTAWYNNQPDGPVYAGKFAYTYKGTMSKGTKLVLKSGTKGIADYAFSDCTRLTSVTIPDGVTSIGEYAFDGCEALTSVTIGNSVTDIGDFAFFDCPIKNLTLKTKTIGSWFSGFTSLKKVTLTNSVTSIGAEAFSGCTGLTDVTIPNSVTSIGGSAFWGCTGLTSVTIPNSVTSIGGHAFYNCTGLTSVTIPNSVTSIGSGAFENTSWDNNLPDGLVYAGKVAYTYKGTMPEGTKLVLKSGTKGIAGTAFSGCKRLTSITIPNSVTSIGDYAFYNCTGLTSVTIPNSVTSIGGSAFEYCTRLTSVTIPDSVTNIGGWAFSNTAWYDNQPDGLVYAGKFAYAYKGDMPAGTKLVLKNGTKGIAGHAFWGCFSLTSVAIPDSVTSIGEYSFYNCTGLTSVTVGNGVTSIGWDAFFGCENLTVSCFSGSYAEEYCKENSIPYKLFVKAPTVVKVAKGLKVTWSAFKGAKAYQVARREIDSKGKQVNGWEVVLTTTDAKTRTYTDTSVTNGHCYQYKVRTLRTEGKTTVKSAYSKAVSYYSLATPKPTVKNTTTGVKLTWKAIKAAKGYVVYRKTGSGKWTKIATVKGGTKTTYTDKKAAKNGATYQYRVKAYNGKSYSAYTTKKIVFLTAPKAPTATSTKTGVKLKWTKNAKASGYIIERKAGSGKWTKLATVKKNTTVSYLDKSAKKGVTYQYRLIAYKGSYKSAAGAAVKIKDKY